MNDVGPFYFYFKTSSLRHCFWSTSSEKTSFMDGSLGILHYIPSTVNSIESCTHSDINWTNFQTSNLKLQKWKKIWTYHCRQGRFHHWWIHSWHKLWFGQMSCWNFSPVWLKYWTGHMIFFFYFYLWLKMIKVSFRKNQPNPRPSFTYCSEQKVGQRL